MVTEEQRLRKNAVNKRCYQKFKEKRKLFRYTPECKYSVYKARAKEKNISFTLTLEEFTSFWQKECHYCPNKVPNIGLDRVDSSKGYTIDNVVSCCIICNRAKNTLSTSDFLSWLRGIASKSLKASL